MYFQDAKLRVREPHNEPKDAGKGNADGVVLGCAPIDDVVLPEQHPELAPVVQRESLVEVDGLAALLWHLVSLDQLLSATVQRMES